jgi:hypothetical protein
MIYELCVFICRLLIIFPDCHCQWLESVLIMMTHSSASVPTMNAHTGGRRQGPSNGIEVWCLLLHLIEHKYLILKEISEIVTYSVPDGEIRWDVEFGGCGDAKCKHWLTLF